MHLFYKNVFLNFSGDLKLLHLRGDNVEAVGSLSKGHKCTVRCLHWDSKVQNMICNERKRPLCHMHNNLRPKSACISAKSDQVVFCLLINEHLPTEVDH